MDLLIARAQVGLAFFFAVAFVLVLAMLLLSVAHISDLPPGANSLLTGMAGVLGTIVTLQQNYFFARQRGSAPVETPAPVPVVPSAP